MKRITSYFILSAAFTLLCAGCAENVTPEKAEQGIKLTVSVPGAGDKTGIATKADTINGIDTLNENVLNSVYYFFYKLNETYQAPEISGYFTDLNLNGAGATKTWTIPASANTIANKLFPAGSRECNLFVVANPPASLVSLLEGTPTLSELRSASFSTDLMAKQSSFVMVYDGTAELTSRTDVNAVTGDAKLRRLANKFTIKANVANSYTDTATNYVWEPRLEGLRVEFYNVMGKVNLGADFDTLKIIPGVADEDYFDVTPAIAFGTPEANGEDYKIATSKSSFYSYPMKWDFADKHEPYILIELPWQNMSASTHPIQSCYYKMMLSDKSISTNGWYNITIDLSVLGSFYKTAPTQQYLYEDYIVLDWRNAFEETINNVDAEIKEARYLVTNQNSYVINNQTRLSLPFSSSHECTFKVLSATQDKFSALAPTSTNYTTAAQGWFHINGSVLEFEHNLHNQLDANMDSAPYEIDVAIYHKKDAGSSDEDQYLNSFCQIIHITQYPAVFVTRQLNSGVDPTDYSVIASHKGYVYVNGAQDSNYQNVPSTYKSTGGIDNPYMTIISVSQFSSDMDFIIGDPRTASPVTLPWSSITSGTRNATSAPSTTGTTNRTLQDYYPARDDGSADNYVAPKLRVVSGWAANGGDRSYDNNLIRCATYQEDGYPAGRWRLPTAGEILYMRNLAENGIIISLFATGVTYWCAGGYVDGSNVIHKETTGNHSSRCVYDEWYWEIIDNAAAHANDPTWRPVNKSTFTWGDQPL